MNELINIHMVLKATNVGKSFCSLTHINREEVINVIMCAHQTSILKNIAGKITNSLPDQAIASTTLYLFLQ